jgi:hypothetical protein
MSVVTKPGSPGKINLLRELDEARERIDRRYELLTWSHTLRYLLHSGTLDPEQAKDMVAEFKRDVARERGAPL